MNMRNLCFFLLLVVASAAVHAQNVPASTTTPLTPTVSTVTLPSTFTPPTASSYNLYNLTRTFVPMFKTTNAADAIFSFTPSSGANYYRCKVNTTYTNGFGTAIQSISRGGVAGSGGSAVTIPDIISSNDLRLSNTSTSFLPYSGSLGSHFQTTPFAAQRTYYGSHFADENDFSYAQSVNSYPSGVPTVKAYSPGSSFVGNATGNTVSTKFNDGTEGIVIYPESLSGTVSYYASSMLTIKTTLSPPNGKVEEYVDKNGRVVCKKVYAEIGPGAGTFTMVSTYYVYDDRGQIIKIITPNGSNVLSSVPTADISEMAYSYYYNAFGSVTRRLVPAKSGFEFIIYDLKNRPVLIQTPLLRTLGKYKFNIYDSRNRIVISGLLTDATTPSSWQSTMNTDPATLTITSGTLLYYFVNGISGTYPTSISGCEIEQVNFYDEYIIAKSYITPTYGLNPATYPWAVTSTAYPLVNGLVTASMARVRTGGMSASSDLWVCSVYFYDQNGNVIQTQSLNPAHATTYSACLAGAGTSYDWDVFNTQYSFTGQVVSELLEYNDFSTSDKPFTRIYNWYERDPSNGGRLIATHQSIDDGGEVEINRYTYDDLGKVTVKSMGGGVEIQNYDYNVRGQLAAINREYAEDPCGTAGTSATFGVILNYDYGFSIPRLDGNLSGIKWRGASHSVPLRAYGYEYDPSAKLKHAEFRQFCAPSIDYRYCATSYPSETWNKNRTDFTASNIKYDRNGNLISMKERGTTATGPVDMDNLGYTYVPNTNILKSVEDGVTTDYHLGEFLDASRNCDPEGGVGGSFTPCPDYAYDADGNMTVDSNKHIDQIVYNEMDQPLSVVYHDGSFIANQYTAAGTLVTKTIRAAGASTYDVYRYGGPFVYKSTTPVSLSPYPYKLQYALHGEGRSRFNATTGLFTYDYFVKDHLGNVRTVVTGNQTNAEGSPYSAGMVAHDYFASHEIGSASVEDAVFLNIDMVREDRPASFDTTDEKCARLNFSDTTRRIGTALMLKVMAGDKFNLAAQSYWLSEDTVFTPDTSSALMDAIVSTLTGAQSNMNMGENTATQLVSDAFSPANSALYKAMIDSIADSTRPMAFINYLVFDEHMNLIMEESGAIQVGSTPGTWAPIGMGGTPRTLSRSGYLAIFLSTESADDTYFDHLEIGLDDGKLIQEQHYYPFGLTINEGESGSILKNKFKYQGKELMDELKLNLYDFTARQYDPQIGRFWGIDPMSQYPSGYTGMGNNPANMIDPTGCYASGVESEKSHRRSEKANGPGNYILTNESYLYNGNDLDRPAALGGAFIADINKAKASAMGKAVIAAMSAGGANNGPDAVSKFAAAGAADYISTNANTLEPSSGNTGNNCNAINGVDMNKGTVFHSTKEFTDFMFCAAKYATNANGERCEVAAWIVLENGYNTYIIQPWADNGYNSRGIATSQNYPELIEKNGFKLENVQVSQAHTHPIYDGMDVGSLDFGDDDLALILSKSTFGYIVPVYSFGAGGTINRISYDRSRSTDDFARYNLETNIDFPLPFRKN